jgi:fatty-acyl-CoA synthase
VAARVSEGFGITPHQVVAVSLGTLPKTSSGKVQRRKTRELHLAGQLEAHE